MPHFAETFFFQLQNMLKEALMAWSHNFTNIIGLVLSKCG